MENIILAVVFGVSVCYLYRYFSGQWKAGAASCGCGGCRNCPAARKVAYRSSESKYHVWKGAEHEEEDWSAGIGPFFMCGRNGIPGPGGGIVQLRVDSKNQGAGEAAGSGRPIARVDGPAGLKRPAGGGGELCEF